MPEDMQAVLLGIVYGDDERISPADRVRAVELLERTSGEGEPTVRGVLRSLSDAEVAAEWDRHFAGELRGLLRGEAKDMPYTAEVLRELIEARAEERARELADAERIECEIEERANQRAEELYRERSFQLVRVTDASQAADQPAQPRAQPEESAAPPASTAPPPGMDLRAGGLAAPGRRARLEALAARLVGGLDETTSETHRGRVGRRITLRVRVGTILFIEGKWYGAGEEVTLRDQEAALFLRGKGRRGVEIVEVIDDPSEAEAGRKLP